MLSERKGMVKGRNGKGGRQRTVPLNSQAREQVRAWCDLRRQIEDAAVLIGPAGARDQPSR